MPYMWWTTGFCWDGDKIKDDLTSWESLWDAAYKGKLMMLDDIRETFAVAALPARPRPEHDRSRPTSTRCSRCSRSRSRSSGRTRRTTSAR